MSSNSRPRPTGTHTPPHTSTQAALAARAMQGRGAVADRLARRVANGEDLLADTQRVITAEHEAAHVVAYLATGCGFYHAQISPWPLTRAAPGPVCRDIGTVAVVSIAGQVVEDAANTCLGIPCVPLMERVAEAVNLVASGEDPAELGDLKVFAWRPELAKGAYVRAAMMLERYAAVHEEIADALIAHGSLHRERLAALPMAGDLLRSAIPPR